MSHCLRSLMRMSAIALLVAEVACSGDAAVEPAVASSLEANSTTSITAIAGTAVSPAPSVTVKDQRGTIMPGVTVTFAVQSGGGSVTRGDSQTNSAGIATVDGWTVGKTAGPNTLSASFGSLAPIIFTAVGTAGAPGSIAKFAGDAQSAIGGAAVATPPAVVIADANGNPVSGVTVVFAATSGGGSVTDGTRTTDLAGVARVGSWTLGKSAGPNTLSVSAGSLAPIIFTAVGTAGAPVSIAKFAGDAQSAIGGAAVATPPAVVIADANGNPVSGVTVVFAVASGGGSVTDGTRTTDSAGVARVGSWTLGKSTGPNAMTARSGALSVEFAATGVAGEATNLTKLAGDGQTAAVSTTVSVAPAVVVGDANGNKKSGITVSFAVVSGGGSVTGGTTTSNSSGVATLGSWTLGPAAGTNTITASVSGLPSVTFTATATALDPCSAGKSFSIGVAAAGSLSSSGCNLPNGSFADLYSVTVPSDGTYLFTLESSAFDSYLKLTRADGTLIAENDDAGATTSNSSIKAILIAGEYTLRAGSFGAAETGSYSLNSRTTSSSVTNCETVFAVRSVSTAQNLETSDCLWADGPIYADAFIVFMKEGQSLDIAMASATMDSFLELYEMTSLKQVAFNDNRDTGGTKDAQLVYRASSDGYFTIIARSATGPPTGAYTLTIR